MIRFLPILFLLLPFASHSQTKLDTAIFNLKKIYSENVKGPYPKKIFFNKSEKIIDIGLSGYEIPVSATLKYKYDGVYNPPEHTLVFSWDIPKDKNRPPDSPQLYKGKSVAILFKAKEVCYQIIDIIFDIRTLMAN